MPPSSARDLRVVTLLCLSLGGAACTSLRVLPAPVPQPLPVRGTDRIRLILRDGRAIHLRNAQIVGDSIVGQNDRAQRVDDQRYAIHQADVIEIAVRRGDSLKTVLAVGLGLLVVLTVAVFATFLVLLSALD